MHARIAVLPGDGIGPEVMAAGVAVLRAVADVYGHHFEFREAFIGGAAIDAVGDPLPQATIDICKDSDAVLLGAVGGPKWSHTESALRPEQGLLRLRRELGLYANIRPVVPHPALADASPIRPELLEGVDICFVRELTGGIYFGDKARDASSASDLCRYTTEEIERVVRLSAQLARQRRKKLTSIDKANVLETSRLWRETTERVVREEFPDIELEHLLVDAAAMHLLRRPRDFDVVVTENLFGDILTDEVSVLAGSLGMLPSASLGSGDTGLYEPIHGSAPDVAGKGIANPCGMIGSTAMLLQHSLCLDSEATVIQDAVATTIEAGVRTRDASPTSFRAATSSDVTAETLRRLAAPHPMARTA